MFEGDLNEIITSIGDASPEIVKNKILSPRILDSVRARDFLKSSIIYC